MATRIAFDEAHTLLRGDSMPVKLTVSPQGLAQRHWPHGVPGPLQLELGIEDVEDAIMQAKVPHDSRGALSTSDPLLQHLPGLQPNGAGLSLSGPGCRFSCASAHRDGRAMERRRGGRTAHPA